MNLLPEDFWNSYTRRFLLYNSDRFYITLFPDHLSRYGTRSTHMGPKVMIFRCFLGPTCHDANRPRKRRVLIDHMDVELIKLDFFQMSSAEIAAVDLENDRRKQASKTCNGIAKNLGDWPESFQSTHQTFESTVEPPEKAGWEDCPRFTEIRDYLFCNRRELALDTMESPIPENTMLRYILANGGLALVPEEWKYFLCICEQFDFIFS
jgi:hypothetical protein